MGNVPKIIGLMFVFGCISYLWLVTAAEIKNNITEEIQKW